MTWFGERARGPRPLGLATRIVHALVVVVLLGACATSGLIDNREPDDLLPVLEGEGVFHRVEGGETLTVIASRYNVKVAELIEVNDLEQPNRLVVGTVLFVPTQPLQARPLPKRIARQTLVPEPPPPVVKPKPVRPPEPEPDSLEAPDARAAGMRWPVDGVVTSRFGVRGGRKHDGIDISAPEGTPIAAVAEGVVLYAGEEQRGYGRLIIVKHPRGLLSIYAHNQHNLVREGDTVKAGQVIGKVGRTGRADGPHLHFEVRQGEHPRNPMSFLPK